MQRIAAAFPQRWSDLAETEGNSERFIFIVGLPRSGTTLLERVLTGLPGVRSNGETDHFARALFAASPPPEASDSASERDIFHRTAEADPMIVAANYTMLATGGADPSPCERVVEKLPMNYLYLGAIHRALPRATLLLVTRSPLDSCFAMYRTLFGEAYPFSYDFDDLARYYAAYNRLIEHWRRVLPKRVHEVDLRGSCTRSPASRRSGGPRLRSFVGGLGNRGATQRCRVPDRERGTGPQANLRILLRSLAQLSNASRAADPCVTAWGREASTGRVTVISESYCPGRDRRAPSTRRM